MTQSIYITSAEGHSGKSTVALGVLDALSRVTPRVGVFRPISRSTAERDYVLEMLLDHDGVDLEYDECVGVTYEQVKQLMESAPPLKVKSLALDGTKPTVGLAE